MKHLSLIALAETVKHNRMKRGITQKQLSEGTGISQNVIQRIERMDYLPTASQLEKLADALDFDISNLLVKEYTPTVYTEFRDSGLTEEERARVEHLMDMMLAARQQILLRKALYRE